MTSSKQILDDIYQLKKSLPQNPIAKLDEVNTNMFVYVGTITDNVLTLDQSATVLETHIVKPTTYFVDWFVKNTCPAIGCEWINVYPSNTVNDILVKKSYMTNFVTIGYLTEEIGRAHV